MASSFNPKSDSSGSPANGRRKTNSEGAAAGGSRKARSQAGVSSGGRRRSVGDKARASSKRAAERAKDTSSSRRARTSSAADKHRDLPERGDGSQTRAKRVGDIRAEERRREREERARRARAKYRGYIIRIAAVIAGVLIVIFGSIFIYRSDLFLVKNVQVEGTSHLTGQEITEVAAIPDDATLLRLDASGIVERLEQVAWVAKAHVHRVFPDSVVLTIEEREPGAVVKITDKKTWVVSKDGSWLSAATSDDWKNEVRIVDVAKSLAAPASGNDCGDGGIKNALAVIQSISPELKEQIKSISAESSVKTSLNLKSGVTVAFGDSNDVELKEAVIWGLLDKYKGKISRINVRVPSNPTFSTLGE